MKLTAAAVLMTNRMVTSYQFSSKHPEVEGKLGTGLRDTLIL